MAPFSPKLWDKNVSCSSNSKFCEGLIETWFNSIVKSYKRIFVRSIIREPNILCVFLRSVERFDTRECSWRRLKSMSTERGCHSLAVLNEKLYAIGGFDGNRIVSTVEVYDPRSSSWMTSESMKECRGYSGAVVIGDSIYMIGGMAYREQISDTVECYKEGVGWQLTDLKAIGKRCFFAAVKI